MNKLILLLFLLSTPIPAMAGDVTIEFARFTERDAGWRVDVTLRHADTGWDHYANEWRLVDEHGTLLARRVLAHPHVTEQPFTRSIHNAEIPTQLGIIYVEASDTVHGWSAGRLRVELEQGSGERYQVQRKP